MDPIKIGAQMLRRDAARARGLGKLQVLADDPAMESAGRKSRAGAGWKQSDVKRAIAAAEQAGLTSYRVEIAPDGTIAIIVGDPSDTAPPGP